MNTESIALIKKNFTEYHTGVYYSSLYSNNEIVTKYFHKEEGEFHIGIFKDSGEVYQLNSDHEIQGVELFNIGELEIRFKSFTGEKLG